MIEKSVRIITCHDVCNYGASLQVYASQEWLKTRASDVKIIDYKPNYSGFGKWNYIADDKQNKSFIYKSAYVALNVLRRIKLLPKINKFKRFNKKYLNLTKRYETLDKLKLDPPKADVYIVGSDQVWNTIFKNGRDGAFYLDFVKSGKKISYSASFATSSIDENYRQFIKERLEKFDAIAVREKSGLDILKELGIENGTLTVDPVFLHGKDFWLEKANTSKITDKNKDRYLLIYDFDGNEKIKDFALKIKKEKGLKIYSFFKNDYADKIFYNVSPFDFLKLINGAETIISNSFHATAFSIIFEKDFFVLKREEAINTRMADLLSSLGLSSRLTAGEKCEKEIDYTKVKEILNEQIERSIKYLESNL